MWAANLLALVYGCLCYCIYLCMCLGTCMLDSVCLCIGACVLVSVSVCLGACVWVSVFGTISDGKTGLKYAKITMCAVSLECGCCVAVAGRVGCVCTRWDGQVSSA